MTPLPVPRFSRILRGFAICVPLLLVLTGLLTQRTSQTHPLQPSDTVVLLLAPGLSFADLTRPSENPALAETAASSWIAVFPTRAGGRDPDPLRDACQTLGRGDRSAAVAPGSQTLADVLNANGVRTVIIAEDGGAAARLIGQEETPSDSPLWRTVAPTLPDSKATNGRAFAQAIRSAVLDTATAKNKTLIVANFDDLYRADRYAPLALPRATAAYRREALRGLADTVRALTARDSPLFDRARLVIAAPVAAANAEKRGERLGPFVIVPLAGETGEPNGALTSPATRQTPGLIAGTDVAAALVALLGLPPETNRVGVGRSAVAIASPQNITLAARVAAWGAQVRAQRLLVYVPWFLGALLGLSMAFRTAASPMLRAASAALAVGVALFPLSLLLASQLPVWTNESVSPAWLYGLAALPCLLVAGGLGTRTGQAYSRAALLVIAAATTLTYLADIALEGALPAASPLSYSVVEAARFYGIGNEASGVFIGAALTACLLFRTGRIGAVLVGGAVLFALANPAMGAKAGALFGTFAGFAALVFLPHLRGGAKISPRAVALTAGVAVIAVCALALYALWNGARPAGSRSHVGEAVAAARRHGPLVLVTIAGRKAAMNAHLVLSSPWAALLAAETALLIVWWRQRKRVTSSPTNAQGLVVLGVAALSLLLFNDSGVVAAATCLLWAIPLLRMSDAENSEAA